MEIFDCDLLADTCTVTRGSRNRVRLLFLEVPHVIPACVDSYKLKEGATESIHVGLDFFFLLSCLLELDEFLT